ncbi:hypothetical protein KZZ05_11205 [Marinobacter adhaerens]|uniref:Uncharacterized protein n=1 Tax=Marinobacter adhaerens (strain DSM 23420 / HP15) TaxID=225937 RepID=E4PPK2_MARAH|nr:hypothetical protein [Marinobacter adhaerens]ADP98873.1 hypothetical protein HP15_3109 [Marinobacter adhaerens HP15]MBW4978840.1 hypothetical protein [Marinobacter adhaerens]
MIDAMQWLWSWITHFIEQNGVVFSALVAAVAYGYKTRLEIKKSVRHALFLVMQVRVSLFALIQDVEKTVGSTVSSTVSALSEEIGDVDEKTVRVNKEKASQFGSALEERFFALDGASFSEAVSAATTDLSKDDPFMANRIAFIAKLPAALEAQKDYLVEVKDLLESEVDQTLPEQVRKNTRLVCNALLEKQQIQSSRELLAAVDEVLLELARKSSAFHRWKMRRRIKQWDSGTEMESPETDPEELKKMLHKAAGEIAVLNQQS